MSDDGLHHQNPGWVTQVKASPNDCPEKAKLVDAILAGTAQPIPPPPKRPVRRPYAHRYQEAYDAVDQEDEA